MNKALLMSHIVKHGDTQASVADAMGISLSRFNAKVNERDGAAFDQNELKFLIDRYGLSAEETTAIFFCPESITM